MTTFNETANRGKKMSRKAMKMEARKGKRK
jgi:hypothetical protein